MTTTEDKRVHASQDQVWTYSHKPIPEKHLRKRLKGILSSPLRFFTICAKLFNYNGLAFFLRRRKASLVHNWCTFCAPGGRRWLLRDGANRGGNGAARFSVNGTVVQRKLRDKGRLCILEVCRALCGYAAGTAAALCWRERRTARAISCSRLPETLKRDGVWFEG